MIKTIRKKLLSGILTLAIVLSLLPAATLSVSAAADFTGTIAPNGEWTKTISDVYADCKSKITGYDNVYFSNLVTDGGVAENAHVYLNGASTQYLDQDMGFGGNADATAYDGTETMKFTASSPGTYSFDIYSFDTETTKHFQITVTGAATAPTVTATGGNPTFAQGGSSGVDLFSLVTAATNDSGQTFTGATLTVSNVSDTSEYLTIGGTDIALINGGSGSLSNGTYNVTVTGGTATITLSGMTLSDAQMGTLIDGVTYKDTAASVTQGNREVKITSVTDSGSSSNTVSPNITATVNVTKLATAANSTITASKTLITADGTSTSTITVTLMDTNGNVVSGKTVTLAQGSGSSTITTVSGTTDSNGQASFTVKSTKAEAVTYTATDTTDSVTVTSTATVTFTAGTPTAGNSTVSAAPTSVEADGTTTSTITVTLKDTNSNPVSGKTVTLAAGSGSSTITTVSDTTDSNGQATFAVKDTVLETVTYAATDTTDTVTVTQTASVAFIAGTPTAANSTVSASEATVTADGTTMSTITVTLKDANSNVVSGKTVTLAQGTGSSTVTTVLGTTDSSGQATFTVKNTKAEAVTYTATDITDSVTVTQKTTVTFAAGTPTAANSTVSASDVSVEANGTATSTITVTLKDASNNVVSGKMVTLTAGSGSSTITTVSGTTDSNGQAIFTVKNTVLETVAYTATDFTDNMTVTQTAAVTFMAGTPTAANSTVTASKTSITADGTATSTITVTLKDANGNQVSGKTVTLTAGSGSSTITTVSGTTDSNGQATFTVKNTKAEAVTYTAMDTTDSVTVTQTAAVTYTAGTPAAATSTVSAAPTSVEANGTATSTITVTLKDANNNVVSGKAVTLAAESGSSTITTVSGTTDASGQATFTVKNTVLETVTYTATDTTDGVNVTQTAAVTFSAGTPTAANSTVTATDASVTADGTATSTITVTLKDANGNPVSGKTVTLAQGSGSSTITPSASATTDSSGQATFTVKNIKAEAVTYTATDTTDSVTVTPTATVTFTAGTPTAAKSTVAASPASVEADGTATSTITVTLKDTNSNPVSGKTVTLTAGSGSSTITTASGTTNANGQATFTVKDTVLETVSYTATDTTDSVIVTQTASVSFTAGTPTAADSTVTASEASVTADGSATSTITVTLKDANGNPVSGKTVTLAQSSGSSTIMPSASATTNSSGQAMFTVKNTKAEAVTYTAMDTTDSVTVTQTALVTYTPGTPTAATSTVSASPTSAEANGTATSTITVTLKDENNNVVSGKTVTLTAGSGSSTVTTVSGTTDANGQATFMVKNTVLETVSYTATDTTDSVIVAQTASVSFTAGTPTAANSTVTASAASVLADGSATTTITVTLKDTNGNPVSGKTVILTQGSGSSTITPSAGAMTDASGQALFTVKSTKAETVTYTATDAEDSLTVTQTAAVTFTTPTYSATINTKLDGTTADMISVVYKNDSLTVTAARTSVGVYTATVMNGTYNVYVNGIYTGVNITVNYAAATADVNQYTVTFDTHGGSSVASQTVLSGNKVTIPTVPAKSGNTFAGWYTDTGYGTAWNFSAGTISTARTLCAKWTPVATYSVNYSGNGSTSGSVPADSTAYTANAKVTVKGNTGSLAKTGNSFAGWSNGVTTYTAEQTFTITGNVTLSAVWAAVADTYTATYSYNYTGSGTYTAQNSIASGSTLTAPVEPTRSGYTFIGWYKDSTCVNPWNFSVDTITENATLYAKWSQNTYSVGGAVKDDVSNAVSGAAVRVIQGNIQFGQTVTDSDGTFTVTGVPNGTYNLVITKGSQEVTVCIAVTGFNYPAGTVTLPSGNKNSMLEVNGSGTPNVVVDKLHDVFGDSNVFTPANNSDVTMNGATVEIKLTVQKNDSSTNKTIVETTMTSGGYASGILLDVDMTKTVTSSSGEVTDESPVTTVNNLITLIIPLPAELQGKDSYIVTRAHDYNDGKGIVVDKITTTENTNHEKIVVSNDKTQLFLYVKYFSTYAIGYATTPSGSTSGGSSASYTISATAGTGGSITPTSSSVAKGGNKTFNITANEGYVVSDVLVDGKSVGAVSSYTFSNVSSAHIIKAVFIKGTSWTNPFTDVGESDWFYDAVKYVSGAGLMQGTSATSFGPGLSTTRGMIVTILWRLENKPVVTASSVFSDVSEDKYCAKAVAWAQSNGIVLGYDTDTYGPDNTITREQLAAILYRYAKYKGYDVTKANNLSAFNDSANTAAYALPAMKWAVAESLISGTNTLLLPKQNATRAQVAVILMRFVEFMAV